MRWLKHARYILILRDAQPKTLKCEGRNPQAQTVSTVNKACILITESEDEGGKLDERARQRLYAAIEDCNVSSRSVAVMLPDTAIAFHTRRDSRK